MTSTQSVEEFKAAIAEDLGVNGEIELAVVSLSPHCKGFCFARVS